MEFSKIRNTIVFCLVFFSIGLYVSRVFIYPNLQNIEDFSTNAFNRVKQTASLLALGKQVSFSSGTLADNSSVSASPATTPVLRGQPLKNPPTIVRAIYLTGWSGGSKKYQAYLQSLIKTTQINAVVLDVKDSSGVVSYMTQAQPAKEYGAGYPKISNIDAAINMLHDQGLYVIGRVAVFEDPVLAKARPDLAIYDAAKTQDKTKPVLWKDNNGLSWVDPSSQEVWNYNMAIAKDALLHGFDEINVDYVRFPTDGASGNMGFPAWNGKSAKNTVIKSFFKHVRESLPAAKISVDIFGQTTSNTDDMGIGQILEDALTYFDYVCPMVYPSHYITGFLGYKNPAQYPYQLVNYAISTGVAREKVLEAINAAAAKNSPFQGVPQDVPPLAKIRPWLQDFNLGAVYTAAMVKEEIQAVQDSLGTDYTGYLLWNAGNIYTQEAIAKEATTPFASPVLP